MPVSWPKPFSNSGISSASAGKPIAGAIASAKAMVSGALLALGFDPRFGEDASVDIFEVRFLDQDHRAVGFLEFVENPQLFGNPYIAFFGFAEFLVPLGIIRRAH